MHDAARAGLLLSSVVPHNPHTQRANRHMLDPHAPRRFNTRIVLASYITSRELQAFVKNEATTPDIASDDPVLQEVGVPA